MVIFQAQASTVVPGFAPGAISRFTAAALYYQSTLSKEPHETLKLAHEKFAQEGRRSGFAVDIGCGSGRDTMFLIRNGWRVMAIDKEPIAFDYLNAQVDASLRPLLSTLAEPMETACIAPADLINASLALPFCRPQFFARLWRSIVEALQPGGRFAGHFFGEKDMWAHEVTQTHHTRCSVLHLLEGWEVEHFEEVEDDADIDSQLEHRHIFQVVARKPLI